MLSLFKSLNPGTPSSTIYDISINQLDGSPLDLKRYRGRYLLFVNVASKCGFTPQYKALQELHDRYKEQLVVVGVPCNQFGKQEPGDATEIQSFCERNFGVTFLITEKIEVKGPKQHPLYTWLCHKSLNGSKNSSVKWNFQKYLVSPQGQLVNVFYSITKPLSHSITKHFKNT